MTVEGTNQKKKMGGGLNEQTKEEERGGRTFLLEACDMSQGRENHKRGYLEPAAGGASGHGMGGGVGEGCCHRP